MIYLPLLGSVALSATQVLEKIGLRKKKINSNHFVVALFLTAVVVMIPLMFFFGKLDSQAFEFKNILIFAGIVLFTILANICYYKAMKWEKLSELEPVHLLQPLFLVLLASIFFVSERNLNILIPSIIAALALIFSHVKKHHLRFDKYILIAILGSLFYALENLLVKIILPYYSPLSMYFFRSLFALIFLYLIFRPKFSKEIKGKERWIILVTAVLWIFYRVLAFYGYLELGLVFTTLILMLSPIFVYFLAFKFLGEKPGWRNIVAAIVILASVLYAVLI